MNENPPIDDDSNVDLPSVSVANRLSNVMASHGIEARHQATFLGELCGLSLSQARRKLRGSSWSFSEVLMLVRHFGASLDEIFADLGPGAVKMPSRSNPSLLAVPLSIRGWTARCQVRLGATVPKEATPDLLVAARHEDGWQVSPIGELLRDGFTGPCYHADHVEIESPPFKAPTRIAILDDEIGIAETLCEWFNEMGYFATPYTSGEKLLSTDLSDYDAFVVDFMLAGGESSEEIIQVIRRTMPGTPILLLTGKLRDGQINEADLATILRTADVRFFEKPIRPAVLAAAIENCLDHLSQGFAD